MSEGSRSYRTEALVIRHTNFGEADRILTLYSREKGKIRVVAKGVRKLKSRKAGHLEPFTRVQLQLAKGRDLPIVTQAETIEAYLNIRNSLETTAQAAYVLEILDRFTFDEEENRDFTGWLMRHWKDWILGLNHSLPTDILNCMSWIRSGLSRNYLRV